jgi:hypothetical protein
VRHSGGAITRAPARVIESDRRGRTYVPEGSAPSASLESIPQSNICRIAPACLEAKILKLRSLCAAFSTGPSHEPDDRCIREKGSDLCPPFTLPSLPRCTRRKALARPKFRAVRLFLLAGDCG